MAMALDLGTAWAGARSRYVLWSDVLFSRWRACVDLGMVCLYRGVSTARCSRAMPGDVRPSRGPRTCGVAWPRERERAAARADPRRAERS